MIFRSTILMAMLAALFLYACTGKKAEQATASITLVYVVRHAEKDLSDTTDNPPLTPEGHARAEKLKALLDTVKIAAIYSTPYQRNMSTVQPLAEAKNIAIEAYEAHNFEQLASNILQNHAGQTVLVCGHSNTVLPIITQLGATPPQDSIADADYSNLFRVTIPPEGEAKVAVIKF